MVDWACKNWHSSAHDVLLKCMKKRLIQCEDPYFSMSVCLPLYQLIPLREVAF